MKFQIIVEHLPNQRVKWYQVPYIYTYIKIIGMQSKEQLNGWLT